MRRQRRSVSGPCRRDRPRRGLVRRHGLLRRRHDGVRHRTLRLGLLAKDQLHPLLTDVIQSVNKVTDRDFENRGKIVQWLITLNQMKATEELTDVQARELELDINSAYQGFKNTLS